MTPRAPPGSPCRRGRPGSAPWRGHHEPHSKLVQKYLPDRTVNKAQVLEEKELPVGVHPVEGLVAAVLRQAVRDVQDVVLGDGAGGGGAELVEQVGLLQQQLLEGALAPLDQVLRVEHGRW